MAGRRGTIAQYSPTTFESSAVPIAVACAMISSLFMPTSGRRIGSSVARDTTARLCSVCDETWPTASPVTIASARRAQRHLLRRAQHHALEQHLPVTHLRVGAQRLGDRLEVDDVELRPRAVGPAVRQHLRDAQHAAQVAGAAEVAEDVVERHATALHLPGGHRRIEATREQRDGAALDAERQAARPRRALREERGARAGQLDEGGLLGRVEIDTRGDRQQRGAEPALDLARVGAHAAALAHAARAHREAPPAHALAEQRLAGPHHVLGLQSAWRSTSETDWNPNTRAERMLASSAARDVLRQLDEDAFVGDLDARGDALALQRVAQVVDQPAPEMRARPTGLDRELAREAQQG